MRCGTAGAYPSALSIPSMPAPAPALLAKTAAAAPSAEACREPPLWHGPDTHSCTIRWAAPQHQHRSLGVGPLPYTAGRTTRLTSMPMNFSISEMWLVVVWVPLTPSVPITA